MHPLEATPVEQEWSAVFLKPTPEVRFDLKGLHALALRGCWKTIIDSRDEILHTSLEDHSAKRAFLVIAAMKVQDFHKAEKEFDNLGIPITSCSFALQLLYALLPFFLKQYCQSIDRLSSLLQSQETNTRRHKMVVWCLINIHSLLKKYLEALTWCNVLLTTDPDDQQVWFAVCCIQLMMGDNESAAETLDMLTNSDLKSLITGLCSFSEENYKRAYEVMSKVKEKEKSDLHGVAVNNQGISEVYSCNHRAAIHTLQKNLNKDPIRHFKEPLIGTLCAVYHLKGGLYGDDSKQKLHDWLVELVSDDFNYSMFDS